MSKKQYTDTFSNIHPSDETIERIMSMTNKKHFTGFNKTLVALVAVISILCSIGLVANAATDGAVAETVSEVFEAVSNKVTILINGKETEAEIDVSEKTNSDGEKYYEAEIKVDIPDAYEGMDIGPKTRELFGNVIKNSQPILWNGPCGVFEFDNFSNGSRAIAEAIVEATKNGAFSLIGGGDSVACINKFDMSNDVSYVSTGGGALLEAIEGKELPGIAAIK